MLGPSEQITALEL